MDIWRWTCVVCGVGVCLLLGKANTRDAEAGPASRPAKHQGKQLWGRYCALCHGTRGQGYAADNAPMLSHQGFLTSSTTQFLSHAIARGRQGTPMGAYSKQYGGPLSKMQVQALVRYIKGWQTKPARKQRKAVAGDQAKGKTIYKRMCAGCHGANGKGKTAPSLGHPDLINTISDTQLLHAIEKGRTGTPMPAYGAILKPQQIADIVAHLKSWRKPRKLKKRKPPRIHNALIVNPRSANPSFGPLRKGLYLKAARLRKAIAEKRKMVLLDARVSSDYLRFHIPGALPTPYYDIKKLAHKIPRNVWIIAYCACPHRASGKVIQTLRKMGFKHTAVLDEGIHHWKDQGYPLVRGAKPFGPMYKSKPRSAEKTDTNELDDDPFSDPF